MKEEIEKLLAHVNELNCKTAKEVEEARVRLLGKKGEITKLFDEFRTYGPELKKEFGRKINELKQAAQARIDELKDKTASEGASDGPKGSFDAGSSVRAWVEASSVDCPSGDCGHIQKIRLRCGRGT